MAKPIPVFGFAYAAFAATNARLANDDPAREPENLDDLFLSLCRGPTRAGANFTVKLGLMVDDDGCASGLCDRASAASAKIEYFWLSQIRETRSGLSGLVRPVPERPVGACRRIDFELRHVLGWRLEANSAPAASKAESPDAAACPLKACAFGSQLDGDIRAR